MGYYSGIDNAMENANGTCSAPSLFRLRLCIKDGMRSQLAAHTDVIGLGAVQR